MGTSILLSTHTTTITMGRAVKLKRQRKRQQQQEQRLSSSPVSSSGVTNFNPFLKVLNPFPNVLFQSDQYFSPADCQFNQLISNLIGWLLSEWSDVPPFYNSFTFDQAQAFAGQSLFLLLETWDGERSENTSVEYKINERFTILLFIDTQSLALKTKIVDNFDQIIFDIPGQFKLERYHHYS